MKREIAINLFDSLILNQYSDFKIQLYSLFQEKIKENPKTTIRLINCLINEVKSKIAENSQQLRELEIKIKISNPEAGFISIYTPKYNYLLTLKEKQELFIADLQFIKDTIPANKINKKEITFESLFKDPENASKVKSILENNGFTNKGVWNFENIKGTGNKTSLVAVYTTIKPLLKTDYTSEKTPIVKLFYKEFGIEGVIDPRSMTNDPSLNDQLIFQNLFRTLLLK